jgi:hypothetical protein
MCCCGQPNVNGQPGYRWQPDDPPSIRGISAPELAKGETLLYDEPGRCGGVDSHCHHYRVAKKYGTLYLLVRHGGGDDRFRLTTNAVAAFDAMDSNARYWTLNAIFHAHWDGWQEGAEITRSRWTKAAAEKRIKTRKTKSGVKVWVESPSPATV